MDNIMKSQVDFFNLPIKSVLNTNPELNLKFV